MSAVVPQSGTKADHSSLPLSSLRRRLKIDRPPEFAYDCIGGTQQPRSGEGIVGNFSEKVSFICSVADPRETEKEIADMLAEVTE